jgi:starvation-inducible outer membrane lipoprotein
MRLTESPSMTFSRRTAVSRRAGLGGKLVCARTSPRDATRYCLSASPLRSGPRPRPCAESRLLTWQTLGCFQFPAQFKNRTIGEAPYVTFTILR